MIKKKLINSFIFIENIYNIDKIEIFLSILNLFKILIDKIELTRNYRGIEVKYILIIIIKYISINNWYFYPLII